MEVRHYRHTDTVLAARVIRLEHHVHFPQPTSHGPVENHNNIFHTIARNNLSSTKQLLGVSKDTCILYSCITIFLTHHSLFFSTIQFPWSLFTSFYILFQLLIFPLSLVIVISIPNSTRKTIYILSAHINYSSIMKNFFNIFLFLFFFLFNRFLTKIPTFQI